VFADPLIKGLPPCEFRELAADKGLRESLWFSDNKDPKVKEPVSDQRRVL
jgi:hypothetical protein